MNTKLFITAILILLIATVALGQSILVSADYDYVNIEKRDSIGVILTIENLSDEKVCFELNTDTDYEELSAVILADEFCLNRNERTKVTVTIISSADAEEGEYNVEIRIRYNGEELTKNIKVNILDLERVELESQYRVFYKEGYTKKIPVEVINRSNQPVEVILTAESELFIPNFEPYEMMLDPYEEKTSYLIIHINETTKLGRYTIPIFARIADAYIERDASFELVEKEEAPTFSLVVLDNTIRMEKGEEEEVRFYIRNLLDEEQSIRLSAISELPTELEQYYIDLGPNEREYSHLIVKARESDEGKEYEVKVYAWNSKHEEQEIIEVEVRSEHEIEVNIFNNNIEQRVCSVADLEVFEVEIINKGDYDEELTLSIENSYETIEVNISDEEFDLEKGESKTVYIAVQAGYDTELGNKKFYLIVENEAGGIDIREPLYFKVIEAGQEDLIEGVIAVVNYPEKIKLGQGEEKKIAITIRNPTNEDIGSVRVKLYGIGSRIFFPTVYLSGLKAGETKTVYGNLKALSNALLKNYDLTLEVRSDKYITTKRVRLEIIEAGEMVAEEADEEEGGVLAGFVGLVGFFSSGLGIGLGLTILIILLLISISYLLLGSAKSENRQIWLKHTE